MTVTLFCSLTNGDSGDHEFAMVRLTQEYIERLLSIIAEATCIQARYPSLFALEFMDATAVYLPTETKFPYTQPSAAWTMLDQSSEPAELEPASMCADTVVVTNDGIVWKAAMKHGDRYFETPLLPVETLRELYTGNTITITVEGGCVVDVEGLPTGYDYTINDRD